MDITARSVRSHDAAFTPVELLVVIAVVAVLAGMLMPAIGAVKESARQTVCLGNLRQIGIINGIYATDWHGVIPCKQSVGLAEYTWPVTLANGDYLDNRAMASCPAWGRTNTANQYNGYGQRWESTGISSDIDPGPDSCRVITLRRIARTGEMPLLADTCGTNPAYTGTYRQQFVSWYKGAGCAGLNEGMVHFRHRERASLLFADSHAESADRSRIISLLTAEYANPGLEIWAADRQGAAFRLN